MRVLSHPHMVVIQPTGGQRDTMNTVRHQFNIAQDNYINIIPNISNRWGNTGDVSKIDGFEGEIAYIRIYERE